MRHQLAGDIVSRADPLSLGGVGAVENAVVNIPHGGHLSLATSVSAIELLGEKWRRTSEGCRTHQVFQSFEWCSSWARFYAKPEYGVEPCVVTGYQDRKLVFVWPLMKMKIGPFTLLRWLSDPFGQYGDVLISRKADARAWMASAMDLLVRLKGIDAIRLRHVRNDAAAFGFLSERFKELGDTDTAPFLDLTAYPDENAYERRYTKDQRKRRKKIRKTLENFGAVEFELLEPGPAMDKSIADAIVNKRAWLKERGLYSKPLVCPLLEDFLCEMSRLKGDGAHLSRQGSPRYADDLLGNRHAFRFDAFRLHHGARHIADRCFTGATAHGYVAAPRHKRRMRRFDLMIPGDPHKDSWSNGQMAVREFSAPLSPRAQSMLASICACFGR